MKCSFVRVPFRSVPSFPIPRPRLAAAVPHFPARSLVSSQSSCLCPFNHSTAEQLRAAPVPPSPPIRQRSRVFWLLYLPFLVQCRLRTQSSGLGVISPPTHSQQHSRPPTTTATLHDATRNSTMCNRVHFPMCTAPGRAVSSCDVLSFDLQPEAR